MTTPEPSPASPKLSVLLPVHNGARHIEEALRSVMTQTLGDFEVVVVDDASTDTTPEILARLAVEDARIRVLRPERNLRLPRALNFGLNHVRGDYVARMDADDICEPTRFEVQAAFLDAHPDIALVGCSAHHIDEDGRIFKTSIRHQGPFHARWLLRFTMAFRHPTFMFRTAASDWRYDPDCTVSEDYDFLARLSETRRIACLPYPLLRYREHDTSLTSQKTSLMRSEARSIAERVQKADLPAELFDRLEVVRDTYFGQVQLDAARRTAVFAAMRAMLEHDVATYPKERAWIWRQTAQLASQVMTRGGMAARANLGCFLRDGRAFLPALGLRYAETAGLLPAALRSDQLGLS